jgi:hypothetical protein
MRTSLRHTLAGIAAIGLCQPVSGGVLDVAVEDTVARVRPATDFERRVIAEGVCGSATFRTLVDAIRHSDLIVYVSMRPIRDRTIDGRLDFLSATPTDRVLRAVFGWPLDRESRIAVLGHELHHAVEVAGAPEIRTARAFTAYFRTHGHPSGTDRYETAAAQRAELQIRQELARAPACEGPP